MASVIIAIYEFLYWIGLDGPPVDWKTVRANNGC